MNHKIMPLMFFMPFLAQAVPIDATTTPTATLPANPTTLKVAATATLPGVATVPKFRLTCRYVGGGVFDPIVYPGLDNAGHHHTFFGNPTITKDSTSASLNNSGISHCMGGTMNKSAYWVPSMYDSLTGNVIRPKDAIVYYAVQKSMSAYVQPIPDGLIMIAPMGNSSWNCQGWPSPAYASGLAIPVCTTAGHEVRAYLGFPSCWDGINLDSPDHKSHMAYPRTSNPAPTDCPASHPVRIASFSMIVDWETKANGESANWRLSSDPADGSGLPGATYHGDYMEGWAQEWMDAVVNNCLRANKDCAVGLLGIDPRDNINKRAYQ